MSWNPKTLEMTDEHGRPCRCETCAFWTPTEATYSPEAGECDRAVNLEQFTQFVSVPVATQDCALRAGERLPEGAFELQEEGWIRGRESSPSLMLNGRELFEGNGVIVTHGRHFCAMFKRKRSTAPTDADEAEPGSEAAADDANDEEGEP